MSKTTTLTLATLATFGILIILAIGAKASWMAALCLSACLGEIWNVWKGYLNREVYSILGFRKRMVLYRERDTPPNLFDRHGPRVYDGLRLLRRLHYRLVLFNLSLPSSFASSPLVVHPPPSKIHNCRASPNLKSSNPHPDYQPPL